MKKIPIILLLALALACLAPLALASGNVTIAVNGRDGFNDYVQSMFVWGDKLLLVSYDSMYVWEPETGLEKLEGYTELTIMPQQDEDGGQYVQLGDERIELGEDESVYSLGGVYPAGDKLYTLLALSNNEEGAESMMLAELTLGEDGFSIAGAVDIGDALIEDYGGGYYGASSLDHSCYMDGVLYGMTYGMDGLKIMAIETETGDVDALEFDMENEILTMSPYGDGKLLLCTCNYDETEERAASLMLYDVEDESLTELGTIAMEGYSYPSALCYDEARARLYYVMSGCVWRVLVGEEGLGEPEAFGDMPIEIYSDATPVMLGDLYILESYDGILGRDVTVERMPEQHLTISDLGGGPIRTAYFDFTAEHPEYAVSIQSGGLGDSSLIEKMLAQSADVDIYVQQANYGAFDAMLNRGYMAELGGSEKLRAFADKVYPAFADACSVEGELYAVPLSFYSSSFAVNVALLEKLGFTEADVPTSWPQLFALLTKLADGRLEDFPEVSLLSPGYTLDMAKGAFLSPMMESYMLWLDTDEEHLARAGEMLTALLDAFEQVDWEGFNLPEETEQTIFEYRQENILFEQYSSTPDQLQYMLMDSDEQELRRMLLLSVADGEDALLGAEMTVAFVNPFSAQRDAAIEYLETAVSLIDEAELVALCPGKNEPIENEYYQEALDNYDQMIADAEEALAKAEADEDDEQIEIWKQQLDSVREGRTWAEAHNRWRISPEALEVYRGIAEHIVPAVSNIWDGEDSVYSRLTQYLDGAIDAEQLVMELERTLQMDRLEDM